MIKLIIETYLKINLYHAGKQFTLMEHKKYLIENLAKYIHFMGQ